MINSDKEIMQDSTDEYDSDEDVLQNSSDEEEVLQNGDEEIMQNISGEEENSDEEIMQNSSDEEEFLQYSSDEEDYIENSIFEEMFSCCPMSCIEREELERGDKIILPLSALHRLGNMEIEYPMLFQLTSISGKVTHCGVLEFTAKEGVAFLPSWMMECLQVGESDVVTVTNVSLPKGTYVKLQPHTKDFLDISNPRAVLETTLRSYTCLTSGGTIVIHYNNKAFAIDVLETKPFHAVSIVETDCEVDFAPPLDYVEPEKPTRNIIQEGHDSEEKTKKSSPFSGLGRRLDGKPSAQKAEPVPVKKLEAKNYGGKGSTASSSASKRLVFGSNGKEKKLSNESSEDPTVKEEKKFKAFTGKKYSLRS